jgi:hypothetical protein
MPRAPVPWQSGRISCWMVAPGQVHDSFLLRSSARLRLSPFPPRPGVGAHPHQGSGRHLGELEAKTKVLEGSWAHDSFTCRGQSSSMSRPQTQLCIRMGVESTPQSRARAVPTAPVSLGQSHQSGHSECAVADGLVFVWNSSHTAKCENRQTRSSHHPQGPSGEVWAEA